jgi:hypothetical protein
LDSPNSEDKPIRPPTPQTRRRGVRHGALYGELIDLFEHGESLPDAVARCAGLGVRSEAETLVALNAGSMRAPRLTSDGIAAILRFRAELPDYMVAMTPDPHLVADVERPIPAEPILDVLKAEGFCVRGERRTRDGATHATLSALTGIHRRRISRICTGEIPNLTVTEADAILVAVGRDDVARELVEAHLNERAAYTARLEEELWEIYEEFWLIYRSGSLSADEWRALSDQHVLHDHRQTDPEIKYLPFTTGREKAVEWFRETNGRPPHPIPQSLREQALRVLAVRRDQYVEEAARAHIELGSPEHITSAKVRDLTRRARRRALLSRGQHPRAYPGPGD